MNFNFLLWFAICSRTRPVPAPRRNRAPPSPHQGVAQGAKAPEPNKEDQPPPIPTRAPYGAPQRQQTRPTYPPIQQSASPRSPGLSQFTVPTSPPVVTSAPVMMPPSVVGTHTAVSQPTVSSKSLLQYIISSV